MFERSPKDNKVYELSRQYHEETEAYDRTVCTGPIRSGSILPMSPKELALINRNASIVLRKLRDVAAQHDISQDELLLGIRRYGAQNP